MPLFTGLGICDRSWNVSATDMRNGGTTVIIVIYKDEISLSFPIAGEGMGCYSPGAGRKNSACLRNKEYFYLTN